MTAAPLPDRRRILQAAVAPELVQAARNAERRFHPEVALEYFAVIAARLHRIDRPGRRESELFAEVAIGADEALHVRLLRLQRAVDRGGTDAELLGVDQRKIGPFHDVEPGDVVSPHRWTERLLGDDVGENDI